ncbi:hypothetical protein KOM00_19660 [Geomonas sp. Red69]|uniref:hypothetical protein n=1 Tax=Geomonas diazotrophica TaxID=2843197 RepID=UPI001C0F623A|nr:hypothetical protein [Geomonas diazotrophica]MBU5638943.1 hypothetical protein [Geomonas diazotrophica]
MKLLFQKTALVLALALLFQVGTASLGYPPPVRLAMEYGRCRDKVVFLGDSTVDSASRDDADKRSTAAFLEDALSEQVVDLSHPAYHLGVYRSFVGYFGSGWGPRALIIPINVRSFSPEWDLRPEYQFGDVSLMLELGRLFSPLYRPITAYREYFSPASRCPPWTEARVFDGRLPAGRVLDYENIQGTRLSRDDLRRKVLYLYRCELRPEHQKLQALRELCTRARESRLPVLFYVTPVDHGSIELIYGGSTAIIDRNVALVIGVVTGNGLPVLDLSHALPPDSFNWKVNGYPNEHLKEQGRKYVAAALSGELRRLTGRR